MSIIQDIRDKYAKVAVVAIALALIGFILTDYFSSRGRAAGGRGGSVGTINGTNVSSEEFALKVEAMEAQMSAQGYPDNMVKAQAVESAWNQEVQNVLLKDEQDKLGMKIGSKELGDILYGPNMPADLKQQLTDENGYDPIRAKQMIDRMLKDPKVSQEQKDNFNNYVLQLKQSRLNEKYVSLLANSSNFPRWFLEKQNADNSQMGKISIVREPYTSIVDSTIKIEDKEISDYISKHKDEYKQEESRNASYVSFSAAPTSSDSGVIRNQLLELKAELDTLTDAASFLSRNGITNFFDGYTGASQMQMGAKDSIQRLAKGQVYGPYLDGNTYTLAKMLDSKVLPDSVKCRHILLGVTDRQGKAIMPDSVAHAKADSIAGAIARGANFDTLETRYTTDAAAHADKGVMTFSSTTIQSEGFAKEFGDFILNNPVGTKKVVQTQFGWHYIEILGHIKPEMHYKVAYLPRTITPSSATEDGAQEEAQVFAGESHDVKSFNEAYEKNQKPKGRTKELATMIRPNDAQIRQVGYSRPLVKAIYDVKKGEVTKPVRIGDTYIVAIVTEEFKEGTKSAAAARQDIEPILRRKKKGEMLKQKIGKVTTLEAAATALGGKQIELIDSVRVNSIPTLQYEPQVIGATFNPANKGKVVPEALAGRDAVYVVRVENVSATPNTSGDIEDQRKNMYQQTKQYVSNPQAPGYPVNILQRAATIKDKRYTRY